VTGFVGSFQASAIVIVVVLLPLALVVGLLSLWRRFVRNRNRRSPLTSDLLRPPGFGLQERIEDLTHEMNSDFAAIMWVPAALLGIYLIQIQTNERLHPMVFGPLVLLTGLGILAYLTVRLMRRVAG
jgi:hypothetical protein